MSDTPPIEARGLVKRYGDITAVDHVELTVGRGDVFGYLGPNGAGKTTSLRMLLGLIRPTEGSAQLFGRDPLVEGARALDGVAGFVEGPRFYPYLSGRRNLRLLGDLDGGAEGSTVASAGDDLLAEVVDVLRDLLGDVELLAGRLREVPGVQEVLEVEDADRHRGGQVTVTGADGALEAADGPRLVDLLGDLGDRPPARGRRAGSGQPLRRIRARGTRPARRAARRRCRGPRCRRRER